MVRRYKRGEARDLVAKLADGTRTYAEIAALGHFSVEYVRTTVKRLGIRTMIKPDRRPAVPSPFGDHLVVKVVHEVRSAILERAQAVNRPVSEVCGVLLRVAVECGDLDTHFPAGGNS